MLLLLSALAHAGDPDLAPLLSGAAPPDVVVSCAPVAEVSSLIASLPPIPGSTVPDFLSGLADEGVYQEGRLNLALWRAAGAGRVVVGWSGDLESAAPLVESLWDMPAERIDGALVSARGRATVSGGFLRVSDGAIPPGPGAGSLEVLEGLMTSGSCGIAVDGLRPKRVPITTVGVSYPLGSSENLTLRLQTREESLPTMRIDGAPTGGSSSEQPIGVLVLGSDPLALLAHPPIMAAMGMSEARLKRVTSRLAISPGVTMAIFGDPQEPTYAWTMGVTSPRGRDLSQRRLLRYTLKLLEDEGRSYAEVGPGILQVEIDGQAIRVAVAEGRIAVGTAHLETDEAIAGVGTPWVTAELSAQAARWPIAAVMSPPQLPVSILMGATMSGDLIEADLHVEGLAQTLQMAMGLLPGAVAELRTRAMLSQVGTDLEALQAAEQEHHASRGQWRLLSPGEQWEAFTPITDGAVYWSIEGPDGSVEVHAQLDADLDGIPARYMLDASDRFWTLTPDGVR